MARPRSIRIRFTLRALLVFVTLFMIWGGYHANRGWRERKADAVLQKHGVVYGHRSTVNMPWPQRVGEAYKRFTERVWGDRHIWYVSMPCRLQPDAAEALAGLPSLESLTLESWEHPKYSDRWREERVRLRKQGLLPPKSPMPEGALARVLSNPSIRTLRLHGWILSNEDCREIATAEGLHDISFTLCNISEDGLAETMALRGLKHLGFTKCNVTGEKLASIPGSESLKSVWCESTPLGNEFADFIARSPYIADLTLYSNSVDDEFIARIGPHPSLENLNLSAPVTDDCIPNLIQLPALKTGAVNGLLTREGRARLRESHAELWIDK